MVWPPKICRFLFSFFCVVSGWSQSKTVVAAFPGNVQEGLCLGDMSSGMLCILYAHRTPEGIAAARSLATVMGSPLLCCLLGPVSAFGCGFKRSPQQMIYLITTRQ